MKREQSIKLIEELSQASGVSGFEEDVRAVIRKYMTKAEGCVLNEDAAGNLVYTFKGSKANGRTICFAAHQDEVGFMVCDILETGFLRLIQIGGWSTLTLPSSPVEVITQSGRHVYGVIGQISPHFIKKGTPVTVPDLSDLFVDIGASSKEESEEKLGVRVGDVVVPVAPFRYIPETERIFSKAFDDRIGCAVLIEAALKVRNPENTLVFAFTTQEEVGERGSAVLATYLKADYTVVVEGAPADDMPSGPVHPMTCQGKGAHVRIFDPTHIADKTLLNKIREIGKNREITIQEAIRTGGGTDAVTLSKSIGGSKAIVTGVPVRYAHSHNCSIDLYDYDEMVKLLSAISTDLE